MVKGGLNMVKEKLKWGYCVKVWLILQGESATI